MKRIPRFSWPLRPGNYAGYAQRNSAGVLFRGGIYTPRAPSYGDYWRAGRYVTKFGDHHLGDDEPAPVGTIIQAPANLRIKDLGHDSRAGNWIVGVDEYELVVCFQHLYSLGRIAPGDLFMRKQAIARVGVTGRSSGPHMHVEGSTMPISLASSSYWAYRDLRIDLFPWLLDAFNRKDW